MRRRLITTLLILSAAGAPGCGDSGEGGDRGFSEHDRKAARQYSRIQAQAPALESLGDALDLKDPGRRTALLAKLRGSAKKFRAVKFRDPRARRAMRAFATANDRVVSAYGADVAYHARGRRSARGHYALVRELGAATDEANAADRRLTSVEPAE